MLEFDDKILFFDDAIHSVEDSHYKRYLDNHSKYGAIY